MKAALIGAVLAGGAAYGGWMLSGGSGGPQADPTDAALVAEGRQVYAEHCAACHGLALEGEPDWRSRNPDGTLPAPPHDETGHTWHHPDQQLFDITKYGVEPFAPEGYVSNMPAYEDVLTDREIWASLAYIKSRWPEDVLQKQQARNP
ncbi:Cytochrome c family protein [Caenispirillum salinarum AK4]|uniref:Cytochrome c family protein n=1 Tax=Caenispirillum salinarum AK4 TaxID=1238182 RepID=K9H2J8_9PROT|nr:Cytochrome c family protein [Caenispirillum salinarum AK4]